MCILDIFFLSLNENMLWKQISQEEKETAKSTVQFYWYSIVSRHSHLKVLHILGQKHQ